MPPVVLNSRGRKSSAADRDTGRFFRKLSEFCTAIPTAPVGSVGRHAHTSERTLTLKYRGKTPAVEADPTVVRLYGTILVV